MTTDFDNAQHWGFFLTGTSLNSQTGKYVRVSDLVLAALRAAGVFDNMVDGITAPTTDKLWLDKNFDPAQLKEWDATGSSWVPMTFDRLFGRAAVGELTVTGGTANAVIVAQPSGFQGDRLYLMTPTATNAAGATTIQVSGVGTYPAVYGDGSDLLAEEFTAGRQTVLMFDGSRFEVLFSVADLNAAVTASAASASAAAGSASAAAGSASAAATSASNAAAAALAVLTGATSDDTFADTDQVIYLTGSTPKKGILTGLIASIFNGTRVIANAIFDSGFKVIGSNSSRFIQFSLSALTAGRTLTFQDRDMTVGMVLLNSGNIPANAAIDWAIPSGVRRIKLMLSRYSTTGTSIPWLQLKAGGVAETSGYAGSLSNTPAGTPVLALQSSAFALSTANAAANVFHLDVELVPVGGNEWMCTMKGSVSNALATFTTTSSKTLAGVLDGIRLTTAGGTEVPDNGVYSLYVEY